MEGFGERLRKKREEIGFNQADLAKLVGKKSYKSVSEWELEKQAPPIKIVVLLAEALQTTPNYLLLGLEDKKYESLEKENLLLNEMLAVYRKAEKTEKELEQVKNIENVSDKSTLSSDLIM